MPYRSRLGARFRTREGSDPKLAREIAAAAQEFIHEGLHKLARLPLEAVDPHWMERLEEEEQSEGKP